MSKKKQKGISIRMLIPMVAVVLLLGCAIGGTVAWLTAQTDPVTNTFTVGNIDIELWELKYDPITNTLPTNPSDDDFVKENHSYKIVPGRDLPKDPFVRIKEGSEPCWVFIKVEENNFIEGLSWRQNTNWKKLNGESNIYYREFTPASQPTFFDSNNVINADYEIEFIRLNKITVSGEITKAQLDAIDGEISMTFTAYAIQYEGFPTVEQAWAELNSTYNIVPSAPAE